MFDDLEAQFFENVWPSYHAFIRSLESDPAGLNSDLRLGKDAALALFHLREHVPWAKGSTWPQFLQDCPEYSLLQDIVNVFKHGSRRDGLVAAPTDIHEVTVLTEYRDELGPYQHLEKAVTVSLRDGRSVDMRTVLTTVLNLWIAEFKAHGMLRDVEPVSTTPRQAIPPRTAPGGAARGDLAIRKGVRFERAYRFQRFNCDTGQIEPIDITGQNYSFEISRPRPIELTITLTNPTTGQTIEKTLELSDAESLAYSALKDDQEREEFGARLARAHAASMLSEAGEKSEPV